MSSFLLAVRSGFGFLSTIPVGITMEGFDELMKRMYLFTFIGSVLGFIIGAFAFVFEAFFPPQISAILIIVSIYYFTGLNHLDGLADFGDGVTAHGSLEKKIKAMKDVSLGIGGAAYCCAALIALYATISALQKEVVLLDGVAGLNASLVIFASMFVSEVSAKQAMLTIATFGKPIHEGLGSMAMENTTIPKFLIGLAFGGVVCTLAFSLIGFGTVAILAFASSTFSALVILNITNRHFGGVNGDGIGTANEVGRLIALIFITLALGNGLGGIKWTLL
ncbi:MAG: adenosylcobinamide-GDP ribazoletransferase [Methanosarcinaceae archaeon]|nr:adenosylcobinamide-GDP ribazoletransferase [Methanosarcinaceae archaeon]